MELNLSIPAELEVYAGEVYPFSVAAFKNGAEIVTQEVSWVSSLDGQLSNLASFSVSLTQGLHQITVLLVFEDGSEKKEEFQLMVNSRNSNAIVSILSPKKGEHFFINENISFQALVQDTLGESLDFRSIEWISSADGALSSATSFMSNSLTGLNNTVTVQVVFNDSTTALMSVDIKVKHKVRSVSSHLSSTIVTTQGNKILGVGQNYLSVFETQVSHITYDFIELAENVDSVVVSAGKFVLFDDRTLWVTGSSSRQRFGNEITENTELKILTKIAENVRTFSVSSTHTAYVTTNGGLWTAGFNEFNQLGYDSLLVSGEFKKVADGVVKVAVNEDNTFYIKEDNSLWVMGALSKEPSNLAEKIGDNFTELASSFESTLALKRDGTLWGIGYDEYGHLGLGGGTKWVLELTQIDSDVRYINRQSTSSYYIKNDNSLWAMGANHNNQFGLNNTTVNYLTPIKIQENVLKVFGGYEVSFIIKEDGTLWSSGQDGNVGYLGLGQLESGGTPVFQEVLF